MSTKTDPFAISMVPLGPNPKISPSALKADLSSTWPDLPPLGPTEKSENKILTFDVGDTAHVFLTLMPGPIPWSDLEGPCATSVLWKDAEKVLKPHRAHVLVTILFDDKRSPLEKSKLLTQVTAALVGTCEAALGVYWGNATMVIQPELFREFAVKILPGGPPIWIWVDFRIGPNPQGRMSGFTTGLGALGLMEIETTYSPEAQGELRERFEGLIHYLLENGPVIKDGDTIGEDENERIKVVHAPSEFGHEDLVMRLEYEPVRAKKKGWFRR
jgi:hypothetical protein